jgi:hypothetical protein
MTDGSVGAARAVRGAMSKPLSMLLITTALGAGDDRQDGVESLWLHRQVL